LQFSEIEQAGLRGRVYEEVKIAVFAIVAGEDGPEEARVRPARFKDHLADGISML
jgi:hypothetical protein